MAEAGNALRAERTRLYVSGEWSGFSGHVHRCGVIAGSHSIRKTATIGGNSRFSPPQPSEMPTLRTRWRSERNANLRYSFSFAQKETHLIFFFAERDYSNCRQRFRVERARSSHIAVVSSPFRRQRIANNARKLRVLRHLLFIT